MKRAGTTREPALVLIFGLVTCGLYYLWWMYETAREIQEFLGEPDISPGVEILLMFITCGIYAIYWDYKYCQKIAQMRSMVGLSPDNQALLCVILNVFVAGLVAAMVEQSQLNEVWRKIGSTI